MSSPALQDVTLPDVDDSTSKADRLRALFATNPDRIFRNEEIIELPLEISGPYVNVLLRHLDAEGTIERLGFGRYRARRDSAGMSGSGPLTEGRDELALEDEIAWIRPVNHSGVMFATADGRVYFASHFQRIAV